MVSFDNQGHELSVEQINYFKDSVIRDSADRLLVCYHGTDKKFAAFDSSIKFNGKEAFSWFAAQEHIAKQYADQDDQDGQDDWDDEDLSEKLFEVYEFGSGYIYDVYLNITNPINVGRLDTEVLQYVSKNHAWKLTPAAVHLRNLLNMDSPEGRKKFINYIKARRQEDPAIHNFGDLQLFDLVKRPEFRDFLLAAHPDCDGLICYDNGGKDITYGCFYKNQIKSISNKNPTDNINIDQ